MPPKLIGYAGRAVVVDPGVFAVGELRELLSCDIGGAAIMAGRHWSAKHEGGPWASSGMLLESGRLTHWRHRLA